jgi:3-oxoacyl-[acyl-carrier protein] reductase
MQIDLKGRTAVVTGAGRGIGRATALELARLGANVVVNDIGVTTDGKGDDELPARSVAAEIEAAGGAAAFSTASVVDYSGAQAIIGTAVGRFGGIDILVNNAGLSAGGPIWEIDPELFTKVCSSHLLGTFNCTRCAAPLMKERGWGRIVNLVSRAGLIGIAGNAAYGAGKGGVFGLTNVASRDLQPFGVTVNAVNPAATDTRMVTEAINEIRSRSDEGSEQMAANLLAALQKPESVAAVIAALCAPQADGVTGEILYVAGPHVGVFDPLSVGQTISREAGWTSEALAEALGEFELHPLDGPYSGARTSLTQRVSPAPTSSTSMKPSRE